MFDPIQLTEAVEKEVCKGEKRKYYRFRGGRFYGGSAAADVVGCNLRCVFCWSKGSVRTDIGEFYSPEEVAEKLDRIAKSRGYYIVRLTGGEPTLCKEHLIEVIRLVTRKYLFVLETNGILIGYDEDLAKRLASFDNLLVRISVKAPDPKTFSKVTGAREEAFDYVVRAFESLVRYGLEPPRLRAAVVLGYGDPKEFIERLAEIHPALVEVEPEVLTLYPSVAKRLRKANLLPKVYRVP
ncbi:molybdenum cofactor biosynthesis protein MoaA [Ignicoccus islandicus DSM 13165]|uniref:Molybdenum cofactor biosynthesis protein MoaA n=1 Tax=Ignicoccus islandicus DSM 13165 TaxID=940295 RepID=A0A0U2WNK7_9CREN|nr:radical SAM protein [Ignicoccus islandicus]ALU12545.1 molybdenum cofactor biosynthesis protein MoaA [Ignicoccus islandicus DSM 13165]